MSRAALTDGMQLRRVRDDDHPWLVELHNDPEVLRNLTNPRPITMTSHMFWWHEMRADIDQDRLIFEVDGRRVGFTKFYALDKPNLCRSLGADIHRDYRGKGLAKPMWTMMLDRCFGRPEQDGGLHRVGLTTAEYNHVAQKVYRDLGFRVEGWLTDALLREGRFYDLICMCMLRSDWEAREP